MVKKVVRKSVSSKPSVPTKSVSSGKQYEHAKVNYDKLNDMEKMEYDLKQLEQEEYDLKHTIRDKGYKSKSINRYIEKIVGSYNPKIKVIKNLVYGGRNVISIRINENKYDKQFFTVGKIQKISDKLSNYLNTKDVQGRMMTSLLYGDLNWKSGFLRNFGETTKLYNPNELYNLEVPYETPDSIKSFNIYIALGTKAEGGLDDKFNDCLYDCLKYFVFNIEEYYKSPAEFKKQLGLKRNDKVPLSCIDKIEKKLKNFQINVRGEHMRTSTIVSNKQINLILSDEHYSVEKLNRNFTPFVKYEEKTPIMWDKKTFEAYDGIKKWVMSKKEGNDISYNFKSPYIIIHRQEQGRDENGDKITITLEQEYDEFIINADRLKEESKGMINLYKTGSHYQTALSLFDRITKFVNPEPILQDETEWIKNSSFSALIWADEYEGELYKYDVKSLYPHLMNSTTLKFPVKRGEFKKLESFPNEYFEYGIYRCMVNKSDDDNINKLFKFNYHNYYTAIDLTTAKSLGLNITLIQDDKPNFLYYSRDKTITFKEVFENYIDILFPLKDKKVSKAKDILNILWGALCQIDKHKMYVEEEFKMSEDEELIEMYPSNTEEDKHVFKTTKINNYYKTPFARLCPFLISQGRRHMTNIMLEHKDTIMRIQTDGFYTTKLIHTNTNVKMGELKYEGYTPNGHIKNCTNYVKVSL
jgi:hypothetical protein